LEEIMFKDMPLRSLLAVCFTAGVVGGLAVIVFSQVLYYSGIGPMLGAAAPVKLSPPDIYRPLFWAGLWGLPFGLIVRAARSGYYIIGFLYFLAPVLALYLVFVPMRGGALFALDKGAAFAFYLALVNSPFGIVTALATRWLAGRRP
jgi:hypothetical protein